MTAHAVRYAKLCSPIRHVPTILLVDDDDGFAATCSQALGFKVVHVKTALEALNVAESGERFDAVVVNSVLPDKETSQLIAELKAYSSAPCVVMAEGGLTGDMVSNSIDFGPVTFIRKPSIFSGMFSRQLAQVLKVLL